MREPTQKIKRKALELGFARVGATTAGLLEGYEDELCRRRGYDLWNVADPDSKLQPVSIRAISAVYKRIDSLWG